MRRCRVFLLAFAGITAACFFFPSLCVASPATLAPLQAGAAQFGVTIGIDRENYPLPSAKVPGTIHAVLSVFNRSSVPFRFTEHGYRFDWQIKDPHGTVVYDYAHGRIFPHFVRIRILTQGQVDYPVVIPLQTQDGKPLASGSYTLRGTLNGMDASAEIGFTVGVLLSQPI